MEDSAKKSVISARMVLSAAAILAVQAMPSETYAQAGVTEKVMQRTAGSSPHIFIKVQNNVGKVAIVGFENGVPVYKNSRGDFFTIDGKTGDQIFIKPEEFANFYCCIKIKMDRTSARAASASGKRLGHIKMESEITNVTVVGVDKAGNTIQTNARGEAFTLDPVTGDMIFVKM